MRRIHHDLTVRAAEVRPGTALASIAATFTDDAFLFKMTERMQAGFTLIELMMVVAIIGILAAIAIPSYQDYTRRAYISEALVAASAAKTAMEEYHATNNAWPSNNQEAGLNASAAFNSGAVTNLSIEASGSISVIKVSLSSKVASNAFIWLVPAAVTSGSYKWQCSGNGDISRLLPSNCRS